MNYYLLIWNPKNYDLLPDYKKWLAGRLPVDSWSSGKNKSIKPDARVFLMRVGESPKGIVASGMTVSDAYVRDHYSIPDKDENAVDVSWDTFAHPDNPPLLLDELLQIKDQTAGLWLAAGSGVTIPEDVAQRLEVEWKKATTGLGFTREHQGEAISGTDKPHLKLLNNVEELAENFRTFQRDARRYPTRTAKILRSTKYWVRDDNSGAFGPGKFLGYRGMDFGIYEQARKDSTGDKFDGTKSRVAIETVLAGGFKDDRKLNTELRAWGERTFGAGAFGGASSSKWRFLTFAIPGREMVTDYPDEITQPETYFEGACKTVSVNVYERDGRARAACLAHYGTVCAVCRLDFVKRYGEIGEGFIHVHHLKPLSQIGESYRVDPIRDLRPVCPNCHGMIHRKTPCLTIEQLKALMRG